MKGVIDGSSVVNLGWFYYSCIPVNVFLAMRLRFHYALSAFYLRCVSVSIPFVSDRRWYIMAKVTYSALVNKISGSLRGSTMKGNKGTNVLLSRKRPRNEGTRRQQLVRGYTSYYSGKWYSLSDAQKELWNKYASMQGGGKSGINAYVGSNVRLKVAEHASLTEISEPPPTPGTPAHIQGLVASRNASGLLTVSWTSPQIASLYVQVYYAFDCGYQTTNKESWHLAETVASDVGVVTQATGVSLSRPVRVKVCSLDANGRQSPFVYSMAPYVAAYNYAFIASYGSDALTVFDVTDVGEGTITHKGAVSGAGSPNWLDQAYAVHVVGDYAYVVGFNNDSLVVIDVSGVGNGNLSKVADIRGVGSPNYLNGARGVFTLGNYAYVASYIDDALTVFDISLAGGGTITHKAEAHGTGIPNYLNGSADVFVVGDIAYVSSLTEAALTAFDISDVENGNITHEASISGSGSPYYLGWAHNLYVVGNYAYVVSYLDNALTVFDISDVLLGTITHKCAITGAGSPNYLANAAGVYVSGDYAYVASYGNDALTVFDISDVGNGNITHQAEIHGSSSPNWLNGAHDVSVVGDYAYVVSAVDSALTVFDISDIGNGNITHVAVIRNIEGPYYLLTPYGIFVR